MVFSIDFVVAEHLARSLLLPNIRMLHILKLSFVCLHLIFQLVDLAGRDCPIANEVGVDGLRLSAGVVVEVDGRSRPYLWLLAMGLEVGVLDEHVRLHSNQYNGGQKR